MMKLLKKYDCPPERATANLSVVLRQSNDPGCPFVTHMLNRDDGGYFWGHYFRDLDKAKSDYAARCCEYPGGVEREPLDS